MARNKQPRKVCVLQDWEVTALERYGTMPNCHPGGPHSHLSPGEAAEALMLGTLEFVTHAGIPFGTFAQRKSGRGVKLDKGTIRKSEMEANAFAQFKGGQSRTAHLSESQKRELLAKGRLKREEDFKERAQGKIGWWPFIHDSKSPTVAPRVEAADVLRAVDLYKGELSARDGVK